VFSAQSFQVLQIFCSPCCNRYTITLMAWITEICFSKFWDYKSQLGCEHDPVLLRTKFADCYLLAELSHSEKQRRNLYFHVFAYQATNI
jgi:hypothetical protein